MTEEQIVGKLDALQNAIAELSKAVRSTGEAVNRINLTSRYVGMTEACKMLGISRSTMNNRLKTGNYPFAFQENGHWRFNTLQLERYAGIPRIGNQC